MILILTRMPSIRVLRWEAGMGRRRGIVYGTFMIGALFLGFRVFLARSVSAGPCESKAACYVTPGGSGAANGTDWNNAYAGLPANLTCGVTYYLAGGNYDYTSTSTTISNACDAGSPLVIYKAVSGGPGNPQYVAGWQASYGTSQAVFSQATDPDPEKRHQPFFTLAGTYTTIDGVVPTSGTPTKKAIFGIHLRTSNYLIFLNVTGTNNTVKHIEFDGIANPYGFQVTGCSRSNNTVTLTTDGNPPWVVGDYVDFYLNGARPADFAITRVQLTSVNGNHLQYTQTGADQTCKMPASPNPATVVLYYVGSGAVNANMTGAFTLNDSYIHDIAHPIHSQKGSTAGTFLRNYIANNHVTPTEHANAFDGCCFNNTAIGQSIFEDIEGTSIATPTCAGDCNWQNDVIYSNLVFCTIASQRAYYGPPAGATWQIPQCNTSSIFSDDNGANHVTNLLMYGNTIVRPLYCKIWVLNATSSGTMINNFLFCPGGTLQIGGYGLKTSYNTAWTAAIKRGAMLGNRDFWTPHFPDPFIGSSDAAEDFRLVSDQVDARRATGCKSGKDCLKDGTGLPPPYNVDLVGTPRGTSGTWTRGAYELKGSALPK
jgi:hypothetical protein